MQNRIVKILTFAPFRSRNIKQYYEMLNVMDLKQIHDFEKGKFMYRLINKLLPSNFQHLWAPLREGNHYNLRSNTNGNVKEKFARTNFGDKRIQTSGARLWNNIPITIKKSESLSIFVDKYKKYLLPDVSNGQQGTEN